MNKDFVSSTAGDRYKIKKKTKFSISILLSLSDKVNRQEDSVKENV